MNDQIKLTRLNVSTNSAELTISGEEETLVVPIESVYRNRLVEGIVITPAQLRKLQNEAELYRCDRRAARLLAMRDHSIGELKAKLRQRKHAEATVQATVGKYIKNGSLDDERYALNAARTLLKRKPCGQSYLSAYLQKRRIARDLAEQTAEMLFAGENIDELAVAALEHNWPRLAQFELETARNKAYNYLARRGFDYGSSKAAFEKLWRESGENRPPDEESED